MRHNFAQLIIVDLRKSRDDSWLFTLSEDGRVSLKSHYVTLRSEWDNGFFYCRLTSSVQETKRILARGPVFTNHADRLFTNFLPTYYYLTMCAGNVRTSRVRLTKEGRENAFELSSNNRLGIARARLDSSPRRGTIALILLLIQYWPLLTTKCANVRDQQ